MTENILLHAGEFVLGKVQYHPGCRWEWTPSPFPDNPTFCSTWQKQTLQIGDLGKQQQWELALQVMRGMRREPLDMQEWWRSFAMNWISKCYSRLFDAFMDEDHLWFS